MLPTEAAVRLHEPLDQAFGIINRAIQERVAFDPKVTQRVFRVAMSDVSEVYYLPRLMARLVHVAPSVRLDVVPLAVDTVAAAMRAGEVDLAIGYLRNLEGECTSHALFENKFVCMVRSGHPIGRSKLTKASFVNLRYVHAGTSAPGHQMIEQWLAETDIKRQIAVRLGHFTVAPDIVRDTDLAVIFPESVGRQFNSAKAFRLLALPFDLPPVEITVHTHPASRATGASAGCEIRWSRCLRKQVSVRGPNVTSEAEQARSTRSNWPHPIVEFRHERTEVGEWHGCIAGSKAHNDGTGQPGLINVDEDDVSTSQFSDRLGYEADPAAATNPSHRLFVEAGLARMSRPDWHGLVGVTRSLNAAICRAHRLHGPDAQSRAAWMTRTAISRRFDENLGNRHRRGSDLKVEQRLPRHRRVLVLDLEQDTCLFGDDGRKGLHDLNQADRVADAHRVTRALKAISPGAEDR